MKKLIIALCMLAAAPCFAILSPLNQRLKEIDTLVTSPEMSQNLTQYDVIQNIDRKGNTFTVITQQSTMEVEIVYHPQHRPGPLPFELIFHPAKPINP